MNHKQIREFLSQNDLTIWQYSNTHIKIYECIEKIVAKGEDWRAMVLHKYSPDHRIDEKGEGCSCTPSP